MFLTAASWRPASCCSASLIASSSCRLRSASFLRSSIATIWGCKASFAAPNVAPAIVGGWGVEGWSGAGSRHIATYYCRFANLAKPGERGRSQVRMQIRVQIKGGPRFPGAAKCTCVKLFVKRVMPVLVPGQAIRRTKELIPRPTKRREAAGTLSHQGIHRRRREGHTSD